MLILILLVVIAATAWVTTFLVMRASGNKHVEMLNELLPDGPPGFVHDHGEIQSFTGPGCGWCCVVNYWYGIPIGTTCTYVCNGGGGGGGDVH